jgi:hypothetical protein
VEPSDDLTSAILNHPSAPTDVDAQSAVSATLILGSEFEVAWITQALRLRLTDPRFDGRSGGRLSAPDTLEAVLGSAPPAPNAAPRFALARRSAAAGSSRATPWCPASWARARSRVRPATTSGSSPATSPTSRGAPARTPARRGARPP